VTVTTTVRPTTTQALVYDRYGGLEELAWREVRLAAPGPGELVVRIRAAALNPKDALIRKGKFRLLSGRRFPKRVGVDLAGEVIEVGAGVTGLAVGARVWGALEELRYLRGTVADHAVVKAHEVAAMPRTLGFAEAAAIPLAGLTALQALRDLAGVHTGDAVLIHGAAGGVGTLALQLARAAGAHVTSTSSAANLTHCERHGAAVALDYARDEALGAGRRYRVVFDVFGNLSFARARPALTGDGTFVSTVPSARIFYDAARTVVGHPRARLVVVRSRPADLDALALLVAAGRLAPVIDRVVGRGEVIEGLRHLERKRARGKIVVTL
jgi:NADPH:quinone reductase-like Zn-dependent oxidoreductase